MSSHLRIKINECYRLSNEIRLRTDFLTDDITRMKIEIDNLRVDNSNIHVDNDRIRSDNNRIRYDYNRILTDNSSIRDRLAELEQSRNYRST